MVEAGRMQLEQLVKDRCPEERAAFQVVLEGHLGNVREDNFGSGGYVVDTLTASLWCGLRADSFTQGVLEAVNLGEDTDTTGAVAGALLGLRFGEAGIPVDWLRVLARRGGICELCTRLAEACAQRWRRDRQT
jgi:ADP-ribosylglycohydrolase